MIIVLFGVVLFYLLPQYREIGEGRIRLYPHCRIICLVVTVKLVYQRTQTGVCNDAIKHIIRNSEPVIKHSLPDISVCCDIKLSRVLYLAET